MTRYEIDGLGYHVEEMGYGDPLVLLHGFTGSAENWRELMGQLSHRRRVIAIDLPGHGGTDRPEDIRRYEMGYVALDLARLLAEIDATPAHWLGYSMGGRLALYVGVHHPDAVRSLILESASPGLIDVAERRERRLQDERLADRIETEGVEQFVNAWEQLPLFASQKRLPADVKAKLRRQRMNNSAVGLARSLRGMGTGVQPSLWAELSTIERPVLLLAGALDGKFVDINRQMATALPQGQLNVIENAGHAVHLEQPARFAEVVETFLGSVLPSGQNLAETKQSDEDQRGNGQLLEARIQARQIVRPADGQPVADKERHG
jgi:2-succinyl-6-hydroxy-2,4-cyclohexadiene-1-carboxylate synthase